MTMNKQVKAKARALAAERGISYTAALREVNSAKRECACEIVIRNDSGLVIHQRRCPAMPMPSRSIDGYDITEGMRVWDYNLDPGVVRLAERTMEYHDGDVWFEVVPDGLDRGSAMNGTRVWKLHPRTRQPA